MSQSDPLQLLESEVAALAQKRREVEANLRRLNGRERGILGGRRRREDEEGGAEQNGNGADAERNTRRRVVLRRPERGNDEAPRSSISDAKVQSAVVVVPSKNDGADKPRRPLSTDLATASKRMFQRNLLGTLVSAQNRLKKEAETVSNPRRQIEEKVASKIEGAREEILVEAKHKLEHEKETNLKLKEAIVNKQLIAQATLLEAVLKKHETSLANFIATKSKPSILYLPKQLDENTEKLLKQSRAERLSRAELIKIDKPAPMDIDIEQLEKTATVAAAAAAENGQNGAETQSGNTAAGTAGESNEIEPAGDADE